jgi:3-hydroxybutyryl-CoA dehydrogenase
MDRLGIVGTGIMGTDIAHLAAESGFEVLLYDQDETQAARAFRTIQERLNKYVTSQRIDHAQVTAITSRIKFFNDIQNLQQADIVLECTPEKIETKQKVFARLDKICAAGTILASNTSSISITAIASATKRPDSVIGIHFMIPARVMKLVEIIPGLVTTRETFEMTKTFVKKLGKEYIECKDFPGFIINRMVIPMINEAINLVHQGSSKIETIDRAMKTGLNLPMGPLELADLIGLDVVLAVSNEMCDGYSDRKFRPSPLLRQYVDAGYLGRKTGRGFYIYS